MFHLHSRDVCRLFHFHVEVASLNQWVDVPLRDWTSHRSRLRRDRAHPTEALETFERILDSVSGRGLLPEACPVLADNVTGREAVIQVAILQMIDEARHAVLSARLFR